MIASMEPHPHERGNNLDLPSAIARRSSLQWSHTLTSVETLNLLSELGGNARGFNGATPSRAWKLRGLKSNRHIYLPLP